MTEKELSQLYWLNRETERIQKDLQELEYQSTCRASVVTGLPKGGKSKEMADYAVEIADLRTIIELNLRRIQIERARLERFIGGILDSEIRLIMRLRHINGMTWEDIAAEVNLERTTVSKKYRRFIEDSHNSH